MNAIQKSVVKLRGEVKNDLKVFSFGRKLDEESKQRTPSGQGSLSFPALIAGAKALALGAANGAARWGAKKALDKISGSGCKKIPLERESYQNWEYPTK
ncbi:uncharacterized protein TNCV_3768421 [Trichonephila clavipes]|nr:uncharacterized protein TNCV_3768421 [Trichonephila clavipes]